MTAVTCPSCRGPVVEIVLGGDDSPLLMRSCSRCDARDWSSRGRAIDLTEALDEIATVGRNRRLERS